MIPTPSSKLKPPQISTVKSAKARILDFETLYFTRSIPSFRWSNDGSDIYFVSNITGRFNIWRVPSTGGWPVQITVSDERTMVEDPSPDGRHLLYTQDEGGDEKPNLFLIDLENRSVSNITNTKKVGYRSIRWSPDGKMLFFAAEREKPGAYSIFRLDVASFAVEKIAGNEAGECMSLELSPDGRKLAFTRTRNYLHTGVSILDLETGEESVLAPIDERSTTYTMGWTPDSKRIYVTSNANEQGTDAVALLELGKTEFQWLTLGDWESFLGNCSLHEDRYVYVRNVAGNHRIFLRTLKGDEDEIPLPSGVLGMAEFSQDGKRVGLLHASADSPSEVWIYDIPTGTLKQVTQSFVGGYERRDFVRPNLVVYPSFDGTPIAAFLYLPPNIQADKSHPAIVYPHGGPMWEHMNDWFPHLQYFISRGFVVIAPNFRGSTGFGRVFMESLRKDSGGGDLQDLVAATDFLKKTGFVHPDRIAFMGGSWGGYLTLMALTKYPDLWGAGVAIVPMANWFTAYENEDPILQASDSWLMGDPVKDRELWRDRSPFFFADRIKAPVLLLAGANDIRCPAEETEQMAEEVRKRGGTVEVKIYENEGHGFARRENNLDAMKRAAIFLETHVGNRPS
jgi:dipeptidyl aminopeptidase/acylaminoacyl peptidase